MLTTLIRAQAASYTLFNVPDEGTQAKHLIVIIYFLKTSKKGLHSFVFDDGNDRTVH